MLIFLDLLTIVGFVGIFCASHPLAVAGAIMVTGGLGFSNVPYRPCFLVLAGMMFLSIFADIEGRGSTVLNYISPVLLQRPTFVGDAQFWRPGIVAFWILLLVGGFIGYRVRRIFLRWWFHRHPQEPAI